MSIIWGSPLVRPDNQVGFTHFLQCYFSNTDKMAKITMLKIM